MPEYYLVPKKLARVVPAIGRASVWLEARFFRFLFWILGSLSVEHASKVAAAVVGLIGPSTAQARKVKANLAIAFPDWNDQALRRTTKGIFRQLGISIAELVKMATIWSEREQRLEFNLDALARAHIESKRPAVFVTAHVGAWQVTNLLSRQQNIKLTTVYAQESNPEVADMMRELRQGFGVSWLPTRAGMRPLLRELKAGNSVGLAMDTRLDTGPLIPFFGVDAPTNISAARLALTSGAALIPVRGERLKPGRFRISVSVPIVSPIPDAAITEQAEAMTMLVNKQFEAWIRETPDQWMCFKRRWPKNRATSSGPEIRDDPP